MACVIGIPDSRWGEAVCALVVARPGARPVAETLVQLVKDRKGSAHAPKRLEFVDQLPLTPVGKIEQEGGQGPVLGRTDSVWSGRRMHSLHLQSKGRPV